MGVKTPSTQAEEKANPHNSRLGWFVFSHAGLRPLLSYSARQRLTSAIDERVPRISSGARAHSHVLLLGATIKTELSCNVSFCGVCAIDPERGRDLACFSAVSDGYY